MKIPSINLILKKALFSFKRFPFAILLSVLASLTLIFLIEKHNYNFENSELYNFVLAAIISFPMFISTQLFVEVFISNKLFKYLIKIIPLSFLVFYTFWLPEYNSFNDYYIVISLVLVFIFHLLVSFIPFLQNKNNFSFWQFNNYLFQRFIKGGLFSVVLYAGLSIALLSFNFLFDMDIDSNLYFELWISIVGVFSTWFFLSGVPENINLLKENKKYPKGLKIFTQFVLLPIVSIYLLILYTYIVKILIQTEWPIGWVSYLVLGFSSAGIFSLLLIYPLQFKKENKFIYTFSKLFYFAIFPLIILLFLAINVRISEYGITENRYFVIALAIWLTFVSVYLLINKQRNIKIIPISLAIISFISIVGPFSAFNISKNSQFNRLQSILTENGIIKNGKVVKTDKEFNFATRKDISSIVSYLCDMHGHKTLQPIFSQNIDSLLIDSVKYYDEGIAITEDLIGIKYLSKWDRIDYENKYFYFNIKYDERIKSLNISGYDYYFDYNKYFGGDNTYEQTTKINNDLYFSSKDGYTFYVKDINNNKLLELNTYNIWLERFKIYSPNEQLSTKEMTFKAKNDSVALMLVYMNISINKNDSLYVPQNIGIDVYVKTH